MKIKVLWETDGVQVKDLPSVVDVPDNVEPEEISDWLSDRYGFLHNGWAES